jgi:uncharacterized protein involved in exopolysaccharide biosynthesis
MSLLEFIQLLIRNKKWVLYFPVIVGVAVFLLTRNMPHTYTSEMEIYTGIASGFNPDNDFENKIDFHAVNSRFDNLINIIGSRETRKDVAVKLLAFMLHHHEEMTNLLESSKNKELTQTLDEKFVGKFKRSNELETEEYLTLQIIKGNENEVYKLIFGELKNPFNLKVLEDIKADRVGNSDMLRISYTCEDPYTCKKTLDITTDIFLKKYQDMRVGEANQAVKYFQEQTALAKGKLVASEQNLKSFRSANHVINYYEQTKYIADQNEAIEKNYSQLQMELQGYTTALAKVEAKIGNRWMIQLQSDQIVQARNNLSTELIKRGIEAVKSGEQSTTTSPSIDNLKSSLKEHVDKLYTLNNSTEGVPGKSLLQEWLNLTVSKQETESKLQVLSANKEEFAKVFDRYAPMGSELNKLEREVETAEKEYLNLLHNLNQAILRQRNLEVSETVSVIDEADLPIIPNPSKRFMMVIASVLSCIIITITLLIIRQYIDNSLASPLQLEKLTGLKAGTAFMANVVEQPVLDEMDSRSLERWQMAIYESLSASDGVGTILSVPFNCPFEEMKKYVSKLEASMSNLEAPLHVIDVRDFTPGTEGSNMVISNRVFPEQQPKKLLEQTKAIFIFFDATQKLDEYQTQVLESWKKTGISIKGILVNTSEQHISKYLGEIPRKRSKLRTFIKKQVMRYAA